MYLIGIEKAKKERQSLTHKLKKKIKSVFQNNVPEIRYSSISCEYKFWHIIYHIYQTI